MANILEARWQDKTEGNRSKDAGYWICPCLECGARLATLRFHYLEKSRMCGGRILGTVLLLPIGVDQKNANRKGSYFESGEHFTNERPRHAARLTHGIDQIYNFQGNYENAAVTGGLNLPKVTEYTRTNIKAIKRQREPDAPTVVLPEQLPITVLCPRPECARISIIKCVAKGKAAEKIERMEKSDLAFLKVNGL